MQDDEMAFLLQRVGPELHLQFAWSAELELSRVN